jgi:hypothetical protein
MSSSATVTETLPDITWVQSAARFPSEKKSIPPKRTRRFHGFGTGEVIASVT